MRRRTKFATAAWVLFGLLAGAPRSGRSDDCASFDAGPYKSVCADVSLSSAKVRPGDTITVSLSLAGGGLCGNKATVFCSYAEADGILVDGTATTGGGGGAPIYHGYTPQLFPSGGSSVLVDGAGGHTVTFKIRRDAPDACIKLDSFGYFGPFVSVGNGDFWSTPVPFRVDRRAGRDVSLSMTATTSPDPTQTRPGEKIAYAVTATCDTTPDDLRIWVPLPSGTVLVPDTVSDGGIVKDPDFIRDTEIQWRFSGVAQKTVTFMAQVREAAKLKKLEEITANGRCKAKLGKTYATDSVRVRTKIAKPTQIVGVVKDPEADFVRFADVRLSRPIEPLPVRLLKASDRSVVDDATTDSLGRFELDAGEPGDYVVEVSGTAGLYRTATNEMEITGADVVQERPASIAADRKDPLDLGDVLIPLSLLSSAARHLRDLNNLSFTPIAILGPLGELKFRHDTTAIEAFIDAALAAKEPFEKIYDGTGTRDSWNALIRLDAVTSYLLRRFDAMTKIADAEGKILSLFVTIEVVRQLMKGLLRDAVPLPGIEQLAAQRLKIKVMEFGVGMALPKVLDALDIEDDKKALILDGFARLGRILFDRVTGQFLEDAIFEVVYDTMRLTIDQFMLDVSVKGTTDLATGQIVATGSQQALDAAAGLAAAKVYSEDTGATMRFLAQLEETTANRETYVFEATNRATSILSVLRGADGVWAIGEKIRKANLQKRLTDPLYTAAHKAEFSKEIGSINKALDTINNRIFYISLPSYVVAIALPWAELWAREPEIMGFATSAFSGPTKASPARRSETARGAAAAEPTPAAKAAPQTSAYVAALDAVAAALRRTDVQAMAAAFTTLETADRAFFDGYVAPVAGRAHAALDATGGARDGDTLRALILANVEAQNRAGLLYSQLVLWRDVPDDDYRKLLKQDIAHVLATVRKAATSLAARTERARSLVVGATGPYLVLSGGFTDRAVAGTSVEVTVTATNVGGASSAPGTIRLTLGRTGSLASPEEQTLTALAAGTSAQFTWTIDLPAAADLAVLELHAAATVPDVDPAFLDDTAVVQPQ